MQTSISHTDRYTNFCKKAAQDIDVFEHFRAYPECKEIIETIPFQTGLSYLKIIEEENISLLDNMETFKNSELIGNPEVFEYTIKKNFFIKQKFTIAPTTLRYIKVLSDLIGRFKDLNNIDIVEIGGGYGGQCKIINDIFNFNSYTIFDLPEVLTLTEKYLNKFSVNNVNLLTLENIDKDKKYDLFLSNYAFTELTLNIQSKYLSLLLNSKSGYITYNNINPESFGSYKLNDLLRILPNSECSPEKPSTHPQNSIITWMNK